MSKSANLNAKIKLELEVDAASGTAVLNQASSGLQNLIFNIDNSTTITNNAAKATASYSGSLRATLMSFRMFSFALRSLRRELGDTNPALESVTTGLIILSSAGTGIAAGMRLIGQAANKLSKTHLKGLGAQLAFLKTTALANIPVLIAVGATIATAFAVSYLSDWASGATKVRREIKALDADLGMMKATLEAVNLAQDRFNLGVSATSLTMMKLQRAIDLQQSGTEGLEATLKQVNAEYRDMQITASEAALATQSLTLTKKGLQFAADEAAREQKAIKIAGRSVGPSGMMMTPDRIQAALRRMNWTEGNVNMRRLRQTVRQGGPGGGGGAVSVTVTFPGANIMNSDDVRGAFEGLGQYLNQLVYNASAEPGAQG